jgi:prophage DNA circulation protein
MSMRAALRPASFRGLAFHVEASTGRDGRRLAVHEYPGRDLPHVEDLGRSSRRLALTAHVVGADWAARRDALVDACAREGAGLLVHPTLGQLQVRAENVSWSERADELGICRIEIEFVEDGGAPPSPTARVDVTVAVEAAVALAVTQARAAFVATWSVAGWPGFVEAGARHALGRLAALVRDLPFRGPAADRLARVVEGWAGTVVLPAAATIAGTLGDLLDAVAAAAGPVSAEAALADLVFRFASDPAQDPGTATALVRTPARRADDGNRRAMVLLVGRLSLAARIRAAVARGDLRARPDAENLRRLLGEAIEAARLTAADAGEDAVYAALGTLRAATGQYLAQLSGSLAEVAVAAFPRSLPILVAAHRLRGDARDTDAVASRNPGRHPAFMSDRLEFLAP